jgi:hypothetical protein
VLHDDRVRVDRRERLSIAVPPLTQQESLGDRLDQMHDWWLGRP